MSDIKSRHRIDCLEPGTTQSWVLFKLEICALRFNSSKIYSKMQAIKIFIYILFLSKIHISSLCTFYCMLGPLVWRIQSLNLYTSTQATKINGIGTWPSSLWAVGVLFLPDIILAIEFPLTYTCPPNHYVIAYFWSLCSSDETAHWVDILIQGAPPSHTYS